MLVVSKDNPFPIFLVLLIRSKIIESESYSFGIWPDRSWRNSLALRAISKNIVPRFADPVCLRELDSSLHF
jgi:hypothetical protein